MSERIIHKEEYKGYNISIVQDLDPMSPSDHGDNGLFLTSEHNDIYIPKKSVPFFAEKNKISIEGKIYHTFKLFGYSHSGVGLSLDNSVYPFNCPWDSFHTGTVYVSTEEWKTRSEALQAAKSLVKEWNDYFNGNVWGFIITKDNECDSCHCNEPEDIDSCWGFNGDYKFCLEQARIVVDALLE